MSKEKYPFYPGQYLEGVECPKCKIHNVDAKLYSDPKEPEIKVWACSHCLNEKQCSEKNAKSISGKDTQMDLEKFFALQEMLVGISGDRFIVYVPNYDSIHMGSFEKAEKLMRQTEPRLVFDLGLRISGKRRLRYANIVNFDIRNVKEVGDVIIQFELLLLSAIGDNIYTGQTVHFKRK